MSWTGQVIGAPGKNDRITVNILAPDGSSIRIYLNRAEARKLGNALTVMADKTLEPK